MHSFIIRSVSILGVVGCLLGYNHVVDTRKAADAEAKAAYDRQVAEWESAQAARIQAEGTASEDDAGKKDSYDGTYTGEAKGFGGVIRVEVTVTGGEIADVAVVSAEGEDGAYLSMAKAVIGDIIDTQSTGVDTVSGATFSSTGIKNAVIDALEQVGK